MKSTIVVSDVVLGRPYLYPSLQDMEKKLTDKEKDAGSVHNWEIKGVEPGSDDVFTYRIDVEDYPNAEGLLFQAVEVVATGLTGRGYIKSGQTTGTVSADSITFKALSIRPLTADEIKKLGVERQQQAKQANDRKAATKVSMETLKKQIEARLAAESDGPKATAK